MQTTNAYRQDNWTAEKEAHAHNRVDGLTRLL
jgi:hypothetical protein